MLNNSGYLSATGVTDTLTGTVLISFCEFGKYITSWCYSLSCVQLCDRMDCSPQDLYPRNSPDKNTGVDRHPLLQGIFPTQGSNPGLLHCKQILYHLSHQGSPLYYIIRSIINTISSQDFK